LLLEANYQRERRQLAARRKAAFAIEPTGANHVWQLDFTERLVGRPLRELTERAADGTVLPVVTIVTDNGGPFRPFRFEAFIATHPELRHVRTRVRSPGQNGSRERGFGTLKYEHTSYQSNDDPGLRLVLLVPAG